jgi:orotidine-5'-phosphate decarboxylase
MNQIIVALDAMELHVALELVRNLRDKVWGFKVNDMLVEHGITLVKVLKTYANVFADVKLHDIPNTVYNSTLRLSSAGADFITVHASGGAEMLSSAVAASQKAKILGVTMLTSLSENDIQETYRNYPRRMTELLVDSEVPGIVCSGRELPYWNLFNFIKVVPGVRPEGLLQEDDQKRTCGLVKADFLVVGRPITKAADPLAALESIKQKLPDLA